VFAGGTGAACTTEVAPELTGPPDPPLFVAVTATTIVEPTSAVTIVYVEPVAAPIGAQDAPDVSHCSH
jgi:hypothetical protein